MPIGLPLLGGIFQHTYGGIFPHPLLRFGSPSLSGEPAAMRSPAAAAAAAEFSDALPSPTSPAATQSHPSSGRHFYLAVDRLQFKMRTLLELLGVVADRRGALPIAACVSSRDELDAVCADVASLPFVALSPLYSDQAEAERASLLDKFRKATIQWNHTKAAADVADSPKTENGIVINMVVGGEVATLKALEESSGLLIAEMPIHEILADNNT
uniref:Uncharacterized protein n=1 Tax=Leersia perrieri TaxID=77586 RepID=A0A0D9XJ78_9ORYZ